LKALHPPRWPVRWRIAVISAGLTLLILLVFALVVGRLASDKLSGDFRDEAQRTANGLAFANIAGDLQRIYELAGRAAGQGKVFIVDQQGRPLPGTDPSPFGPPRLDVIESDDYEVASQRLGVSNSVGQTYYVQYARNRSSLDSSINRLWLLLGLGVLGGSALALLAGLAVAQRAMRPIANLTAAARQVATTRDPSQRIPMPETDDEVAELAATLDQMLRELDAARGETKQMIQAQRDFVADASHELRTPLTSILANLELLEEQLAGQGADAEQIEMIAGALGSSRRMRRLVADLLLLARADAGRSGPRRACDLREIAAAALAEVRVVAGDRTLSLDAREPVIVECDPDELHRLVVNLLENGVRHTPPGSEIEATVAVGDESAVLEVCDDGPGLPEDAGDQIFARFVRGAGPADLLADTGTGLGLAIVKAVATSHGGTVVAGRSERGGARFTVSLPVASESLASVYMTG
jgi:two-component system, OmpR family, sensor kinase